MFELRWINDSAPSLTFRHLHALRSVHHGPSRWSTFTWVICAVCRWIWTQPCHSIHSARILLEAARGPRIRGASGSICNKGKHSVLQLQAIDRCWLEVGTSHSISQIVLRHDISLLCRLTNCLKHRHYCHAHWVLILSCLFFPHQLYYPSLFAPLPSLLFPSSSHAFRITVTARSGDPDIVASSDFEFPVGLPYRNYTWSSSQYSSDEIIISKDFPCKAIVPSTLVSSSCNPATSYQPGRGKPVYIGRQGNSDYCGSDLTHTHTRRHTHRQITKACRNTQR
jgi:hypothetical protein